MARRYKLTGCKFGGLNPVDFDPEIDCPDHCCHNCHSPDHERKNCPESKWPEPICNNCGRTGTTVVGCPRCKDAYVLYIERQTAQAREKAKINALAAKEELQRYKREREEYAEAPTEELEQGEPGPKVGMLLDTSIPEDLPPPVNEQSLAELQINLLKPPAPQTVAPIIGPQPTFTFERVTRLRPPCLPRGQMSVLNELNTQLERVKDYPGARTWFIHCLCLAMENHLSR